MEPGATSTTPNVALIFERYIPAQYALAKSRDYLGTWTIRTEAEPRNREEKIAAVFMVDIYL